MRGFAAALVVLSACTGPQPHAASVEVAVTVDDLPVHGPLLPGQTRRGLAEAMLATFRAHGVPNVTGFVNGARVDDDTQGVLRAWHEAGQPLGNHSFSHPDLDTTPVTDWEADVARNDAVLARFEPDAAARHLFRFPFLHEGPTVATRAEVRRFLAQRGDVTAQVTLDMDDWAFNEPLARCVAKGDDATAAALRQQFADTGVDELRRMRSLSRQLEGRDVAHVLLLHLGVADVAGLDALLTAFEREGVRWVTLPHALEDPVYAVDPGLPMTAGTGFLYFVAKSRGVKAGPPIYARGLEEELEQRCR